MAYRRKRSAIFPPQPAQRFHDREPAPTGGGWALPPGFTIVSEIYKKTKKKPKEMSVTYVFAFLTMFLLKHYVILHELLQKSSKHTQHTANNKQ